MGTSLPLKRKEIGSELSLYYVQSTTSLGERQEPWNVHCQCFGEKIFFFCQTTSKTKQVNKQNYCSKGAEGNGVNKKIGFQVTCYLLQRTRVQVFKSLILVF